MLFTEDQINSVYTDTIKEYLSQGYQVMVDTYNSTYDQQKIRMKKPNDTTCVYVISAGCRTRLYNDIVTNKPFNKFSHVYISTYFINVRKLVNKNSKTLNQLLCSRNTNVIEISMHAFYKVGESANIYTDSADELYTIFDKRSKRFDKSCKFDALDNNVYNIELDKTKLLPNLVDNIMKKVNTFTGFKRANATCIKHVSLFKECNKLRGCVICESGHNKKVLYYDVKC